MVRVKDENGKAGLSSSVLSQKLKQLKKSKKTASPVVQVSKVETNVAQMMSEQPDKVVWTQNDFLRTNCCNNDRNGGRNPNPKIEPNELEPPIINSKSSLEAFVWPLSVKDFLQCFFHQKRAYACTAGSRDRVRGIVQKFLSNLDVETMLEESASVDPESGGNEAGIFVWTRDAESGKIQSFSVEPKAALMCFNAQGSTAALYFRSPQRMANQFANSFAMQLGMDFTALYTNGDAKPEIEMFVSHKGHYTDWHTDFQENFTIQLKGSKKWKLAKGAVKAPLRGCTPHYYDNDDVKETQMKAHRLCSSPDQPMAVPEEWEEVILGEGDVLYHPAGMWHAVETLEESVSLNVSLIGSTWSDLLCDGVKQLLWKNDLMRSIVTFPLNEAKVDVESARKMATEAIISLRKAVDSLIPEDLLPNSLFHLGRNSNLDETSLAPESILIPNRLAVIFKSSDMASLSPCGSGDNDQQEIDESLIMHYGFGNESMESRARVEIPIQNDSERLVVEAIISQGSESFKAKSVSVGLDWNEDVRPVLLRLLAAGALSVIPSQ